MRKVREIVLTHLIVLQHTPKLGDRVSWMQPPQSARDEAMTKKVKFKKRYVLGEGRPNFYYAQELVGVVGPNHRSYLIGLNIADELKHPNVPKYRLLLERVKPRPWT